ncbi:MAG: hypothetical protein Q7R41_18410 [Phycisphaerales bacterium]|nr:hypothetical protein [Phycisphaerales bacterium]
MPVVRHFDTDGAASFSTSVLGEGGSSTLRFFRCAFDIAVYDNP